MDWLWTVHLQDSNVPGVVRIDHYVYTKFSDLIDLQIGNSCVRSLLVLVKGMCWSPGMLDDRYIFDAFSRYFINNHWNI